MKAVSFSCILFCLLLFNFRLKAQDKPIALDLQKHVDLLTGNFNYQIPLMEVSGPNGESFPIKLVYNAGIKVEQEASWVGLGWNIPLGEISRNVNGVPDDWNGKTFKEKYNNGLNFTTNNHTYYGPIYFNNLPNNIDPSNTNVRMDLMASKRSRSQDEPVYEGPDYDDYYVNGPGINGEIRPYLFDFANFFSSDEGSFSYGNPSSSTYKKFTKETQFRFKGDGKVKVTVPYYDNHSTASDLSSEYFRGPQYNWFVPPNLDFSSKWDDALKRPSEIATLAYDFGGDYNPSITNERHKTPSSQFVEYFTNQEIYDHYNSTSVIEGFLDYDQFTSANCNRNNNNYYDPDGIGAFRVTMPNGMVYHYSLPVYTQKNVNRKISDIYNITIWNIPVKYVIDYETFNKYASSWKLTAITGPNFIDNAPYNVVDLNDKGYWIKIDYQKWATNAFRSFPFYNFDTDRSYASIPVDFFNDDEYSSIAGSVRTNWTDIYYPESIQTATQTAFFIKNTRSDNYYKATSNRVIPNLRLTNILLIDNQDKNDFFQQPTSLTDMRFPDMSSLTENSSIIHETDFTSQVLGSNIENKILKNVDFIQDYSLAKMVYNNINNNCNESIVTSYFGTLYEESGTITTSGPANESGKLTLLGVNLKGFQNESIYSPSAPAYSFIYNSGNNNPNYDQELKDNYGYYRAQHHTDSRKKYYQNRYSKDFIDAWSLKTIVNPLGSRLNIDYECDTYTGTLYRSGYKESKFYHTPMFWENNTGILSNRTTSIMGGESLGGGIRVKEISIEEEDQSNSYSLKFNYNGGKVGITPSNFYIDPENSRRLLSKHITDRFAPSSSVLYWRVKVTPVGTLINGQSERKELGYTEYSFDNRHDNFSTTHIYGERHFGDHEEGNVDVGIREFVGVIFDDINSTGRLKKIRSFAASGELLEEKYYEYFTEKNKKGSIKEIFFKEFHFPYPDPSSTEPFNDISIERVFTFEERNTYLKSITTTNGSNSHKVIFSHYDKYTGLAKQKEVINNYNSDHEESTVFESTFAYTSHPNMGLKAEDISKKNILLPKEKYNYGKRKTSERLNVWKKYPIERILDASGNFTFQQTTIPRWHISKIKRNNLLPQNQWDIESHNTLFDSNGNLLEVKNNDGTYNSFSYDFERQLPISSAIGANYKSYFHCGFEFQKTVNGNNYFEHELTLGNTQLASTPSISAHTGNFLAKITSEDQWGPTIRLKRETEIVNSENIERGIIPGKEYEASVWIHEDSPELSILVVSLDGKVGNNQTYSQWFGRDRTHGDNITIGEWTLVKLKFTVPSDFTTPASTDNISIYCWNHPTESGNMYIDDLRLQPLDAQIEATIYDSKRRLPKYVLNNENFYTMFEYDAAGNIIKTYKETESGVIKKQENNYHYAQ